MDEDVLKQLKEELSNIKERLHAIEKEQRYLQQDILSGDPKESMQRRLLNGTPEKTYHQKTELRLKFRIKFAVINCFLDFLWTFTFNSYTK